MTPWTTRAKELHEAEGEFADYVAFKEWAERNTGSDLMDQSELQRVEIYHLVNMAIEGCKWLSLTLLVESTK